jgi:two-component system, cell cycle response regulator DivK
VCSSPSSPDWAAVAGEPVLVVDDTPANQKLLEIVLAGEHYDVRVAGSAEEARAVLETFRPQMILMDVLLPGVGGLELTRQLRADPRTRDIFILGLTACAMPGDAERVLAAGCDGYLTKPIDVHNFLATVAGHLRP